MASPLKKVNAFKISETIAIIGQIIFLTWSFSVIKKEEKHVN